MNKKAKILSFFFLATLFSVIYLSSMPRALVVTDQLEVKEGSYVEGAIYYSNNTVTDKKVCDTKISVAKIINATDVNLNVIQFRLSLTNIDVEDEEDFTVIEIDTLVFEHNRSAVMGAARVYLANSTFSVEMNIIQGHTIEDWTNINNTVITFGNGTSYRYGDIEPSDPIYSTLLDYMFVFAFMNLAGFLYHMQTLYAISPTANNGDLINYYNLDTYSFDHGTVVGHTTVTDTNGNNHNTIQVKYAYANPVMFGSVMPEVNAYYEEKTGLLIRSIGTDGTETYEFAPANVKIKSSLPFPFPFTSLVLSIILIGTVVVLFRRRK